MTSRECSDRHKSEKPAEHTLIATVYSSPSLDIVMSFSNLLVIVRNRFRILFREALLDVKIITHSDLTPFLRARGVTEVR